MKHTALPRPIAREFAAQADDEPGLWEAVSYNGELSYEPDTGDGRWRRSVYSYWKRTAPPPGIQMLDGPTRETCTLRRPRTNTPLQALLLLNDETQVEAARALASAVLKDTATADDAARLHELFARATQRAAEPAEPPRLGLEPDPARHAGRGPLLRDPRCDPGPVDRIDPRRFRDLLRL